MAHILLVDDKASIRDSWRKLLASTGHTTVDAGDVDEALIQIRESQKNPEVADGFDLILLDHDLDGGEIGIDLIKELDLIDPAYYQYRIIVITGHEETHIAKEYAKLGVVDHLIKPVSEAQFHNTIVAVLERRDLYINQKEDWQQAFDLLEKNGLLESVETLKENSKQVNEQYDALKQIYDELLADLKRAGTKEGEIASAYQCATDALNASKIGISSIVPTLDFYKVTRSFIQDLKQIFATDKLRFFILHNYLKRIKDAPLEFRIRQLNGGAPGHYEYRAGRDYRLYFRKLDDEIILERFGHKNIQDNIIEYLCNRQDPVVHAVEQELQVK